MPPAILSIPRDHGQPAQKTKKLVIHMSPERESLRHDFHLQFSARNRLCPPVDWRISDDAGRLRGRRSAEMEPTGRSESSRARQTSRSGCWSIPRFIPPAPARTTSDLVAPDRFPVYRTGRGGQHTYHGPGQRVAYVMLDLKRRSQDVRAFVSALEAWLINTLWHYHIRGERREDRVGVWVRRPDRGANVPGRQDRRHRHPAAQMGHLPRHQLQRGAGAGAFLRHRPLRRQRTWRHQPGRPGHPRDHGGKRHVLLGRVREDLRADDHVLSTRRFHW
jgi:hypothetical protein